MSATEHDSLRQQVRDAYGAIAASMPELTALLAAAGFRTIRIAPKEASREYLAHWAPGRGIENDIASASIEAIKEPHA